MFVYVKEDNIDTTEGHCFQIRYQHNKTSLRSHQVYGDFDTVESHVPTCRPCSHGQAITYSTATVTNLIPTLAFTLPRSP
eukprot:1314843-Amorphochlora_amoeboformis.AAC.1